MKIAIATDAWLPQTNGVVTTLTRTVDCLRSLGHEVVTLTPDGFRTVPCPTYPEIRLALFQGREVADWLEREQPDALHVATEGPLGLAARRAALRWGLCFTTSYHTQFPQYVRARYPIPERFSYAVLRRFHAAAARTMVGTTRVSAELRRHGFRNLVQWTRGVDTTLFRPRTDAVLPYPGPVLIYVGRVAVEKSIEDFLRADVPGTKLVVGGGPALEDLRSRYPQAVFAGYRYGEELARLLAGADVFVFPSRTDTFGLVMLEAMASGLPVIGMRAGALPELVVPGTGVLTADISRDGLVEATRTLFSLDPKSIGRHARRRVEERYAWDQTLAGLVAHYRRVCGQDGAQRAGTSHATP